MSYLRTTLSASTDEHTIAERSGHDLPGIALDAKPEMNHWSRESRETIVKTENFLKISPQNFCVFPK